MIREISSEEKDREQTLEIREGVFGGLDFFLGVGEGDGGIGMSNILSTSSATSTLNVIFSPPIHDSTD